MIARKYKISAGYGSSVSPLVSFDKALINAGVGNYNLQKLSSILPAKCIKTDVIDIEEGSLLPVAFSRIESDVPGERLVSTIGVGYPVDEDHVGVIMEYSVKNTNDDEALATLDSMIEEAFSFRGWKLKNIEHTCASATVKEGETLTTFACIAEW